MASIQFDVCLQSFLADEITPKPMILGQRRIHGGAWVCAGPPGLAGGPLRFTEMILNLKKRLKMLNKKVHFVVGLQGTAIHNYNKHKVCSGCVFYI